ncbi:ABC transporter permease [Paenibacillus agaridevorans]|uniref:ABC transporter permease n=1 Tax=Paenibacillus agaridevorans TaxID=171404 RepID=UPI000D58F08B|nr:ABC transporter permease [Paenibacillus agaridevorans]
MNKLNVILRGFFKYRNLLMELVIRDIKTRYRRSVLGLLWTLLNPLLTMIVMTIVFSALFRTQIEHFPVYLLSGSILFTLNIEATNTALTSIIGNGSLIKKVYIPKYLFPLSRVVSSLVNFCFAFLALLIVMAVTGAPFQLSMLLAIVPVFYLVLFTTGLSLALSALTVFFRDIAHLYSVFALLWTYLTPIFYPITIIPERYMVLFEWNPMFHYVNYFRKLILEGTVPGLTENLLCLSIGIMALAIGLVTFYRTQDRFILHI